eukprot:CAMPEP_0197654608 /NCGR_PEP_ID=MMETSP1338-20131121/38951_1 /TAXON_ID=43686 ORGANISM="Pelagodinium beii, Strain RCC1491" /NCGR_SAMPLE_ID=MMETSP1338 /ASSEMBLY_ACC=CAM_ASM_000754 /LENGTH=180 /DNA_ID=CAMNT_0043230083 /DNA_START=46 /DNA_END=588 /DNA_ORIENTATION=-
MACAVTFALWRSPTQAAWTPVRAIPVSRSSHSRSTAWSTREVAVLCSLAVASRPGRVISRRCSEEEVPDYDLEKDLRDQEMFKVGQRVECRDSGDEEWKKGEIVSFGPMKILPDYYESAFSFDEVRPSTEDGFQIDQRVECRDGDEDWKPGKVVSLEPLKVLADYYESPFTYDEVRPLQE